VSVYRQPFHKKNCPRGAKYQVFSHFSTKFLKFLAYHSNLTYNSSGCSSKNFKVAGQSQPFAPFSQEYHAPPCSISFFSSFPCESGKFFAEKMILCVSFVESLNFSMKKSMISGIPQTKGSSCSPLDGSVKAQVSQCR